MIYQCDKDAIEKLDADASTYNEKYPGCQLFDIFERNNQTELAEFLNSQNPALFALWQIRNADQKSAIPTLHYVVTNA